MRSSVILAFLLIAACAQSPEPPLTYAEAPPGEAPPPASLAGNWEVMLLDGEKRGAKMYYRADDARIWMMPDCAGQGHTYRIDGDRIAMTRFAPAQVCAVGLPPAWADYRTAFDAADTVESAPAGAIRLHGGGHVLLLVPHETD